MSKVTPAKTHPVKAPRKRRTYKEKGHYMGVVLTTEQRNIIELVASKEGRSLSNTIRMLIDIGLSHHQKN